MDNVYRGEDTSPWSFEVSREPVSSHEPPFSYSGAKRQMRPYIMDAFREYFPNEMHLASPFLGAGSVELAWMHEREGTCTASDADRHLVNFWHHARHSASRIADVAETLMPVDRELYEAWIADMRANVWTSLEDAARFFILRHAKIVHSWERWERRAEAFNQPDMHRRFFGRLRHFTAPRVEVVCEDFRDFLSETDSLIYADSPYFSEDKSMESVYDGGVVPPFTRADHEALADALLSRKGWIASNHNHRWVRDRYQDVHQVTFRSTAYGSRNLHGADTTAEELLLISPL